MRLLIYKILNRMLHSGWFGDIPHRKALFQYIRSGHPLHYVDIGAFHGYFFETVKKEVTLKSAVLIEPQPALADELRKKYAAVKSVNVFETVLSDKNEDVSFYRQSESATSSMLRMDETILGGHLDTSIAEVSTHKATLLDDLLKDDNRNIDLLKIDVQGAELLVLRGASNTLKRTSYIWVEVSFKPLYENSATFSDIYAFMNAHQFQLISMLEGYRNKNGELLQADCLFQQKSQ
jgi:FkbM family methyltransferase